MNVVRSRFRGCCQNLRSALHLLGLLPALWTNVDCNASKALSLFHLHSCAAEKGSPPPPSLNTAGWLQCLVWMETEWKILLEDTSRTCQHFMDQPHLCESAFFQMKIIVSKAQTHNDHLVDFNQLLLPWFARAWLLPPSGKQRKTFVSIFKHKKKTNFYCMRITFLFVVCMLKPQA